MSLETFTLIIGLPLFFLGLVLAIMGSKNERDNRVLCGWGGWCMGVAFMLCVISAGIDIGQNNVVDRKIKAACGNKIVTNRVQAGDGVTIFDCANDGKLRKVDEE